MHLPRLLAIASLAALSVQPALAAVHDLPTASAESEGMSAERLARLSAGMKEIVDSGRLAGAVTMVSRHGKVVESGDAAELFKNPKTDYTRALFAAAFNLETAPTGVVAQ